MTAKEIQEFLFDETGLKTSVKKMTGSMKGYLKIWPIFQNGVYPNIPFEIANELKLKLKEFNHPNNPVFCSTMEIDVYGVVDDRIKYKKESKPKSREEMKVKEWGSKNSQMRLDKASARYAKKIARGDNCATYM